MPDRTAELRNAVAELAPSLQADLEQLVRIPSISAPSFDPRNVRQSADTTAQLLEAAGFRKIRLLEVDGAHPAVFGMHQGRAGQPTVLLYAHHDVQPPGDDRAWASHPFEPVARGGRLYGRGTADNKAGIIIHCGGLRAHQGNSPIGLTVFIEGEEELGSPHMSPLLHTYRDLLRADVVIVSDAQVWRSDQPALMTSLRGLVDCVVEVRTFDHAVHSGLYGGIFPDALSALTRLLASLYNEDGAPAVSGLVSGWAEPLDLTEDEVRQQVGSVEGLELLCDESAITTRLWRQPAISVLAVDAPRLEGAINELVPVARAKISLRIAPGDDPDRALSALIAHLKLHAPWGVEVEITPGAKVSPFESEIGHPVFHVARQALRDAWGRSPVLIGCGGTVPVAEAFARHYPRVPVLLAGAADPESRPHGPDESVNLQELERACLAEALLFDRLVR